MKRTGTRSISGAVALAMVMAFVALVIPLAQPAAAAGEGIDCSPEGDINPTGTQHTVTCEARSTTGGGGVLVDGADVDYQVAGINPTGPQHGCTTDATGQCSFTYTGNSAGNDVIQAWVNQDGNHIDNDCGAEATADTEDDDFCDQMEKSWQTRTATFLDIEPETDTNPNGSSHMLTATFTDQFGDPIVLSEEQLVDFEIISGPNANQTPGLRDFECTSPDPTQGGTCTAIYTDSIAFNANNATDTICAWLSTDGDDDIFDPNGSAADGGDCDAETPGETEQGVDPNNQNIPGDEGNDQTDTVLKTWSVVAIDCGPEGDINPRATQHTVTCEARSTTGGGGVLVDGADVDYQVAGINPTGPQHGCTTDATGRCSFTYTGNSAGNDVIQAWVNQDGNHINNDCGAEATADTEDDDFCDQMEKSWQTRTATFLDIEPETDTNPNGSTHTLTATFTDQFGDPIELSEAQLVDFEIISGPNTNFQPGFRDFECPSNNPTQGGTCTASYNDSLAFDANNAADTICAWLSTDGDDDQFDPNGSAADGGDCDAETPGETEQGVNPNNENIPGDEGNDNTDTVLKTWAGPPPGPATQINAEPETDSNPVTTEHIFGAFAGDASNQETTVTPVRADILPGSANDQQIAQAEINCVVDPNPGTDRGIYQAGQSETHECSYTGSNVGTDTIRVFADTNNNNIFDQGEPFDDITKTWFEGPTSGPCSGQAFNTSTPIPGGTGNIVVGSPGDDALTGTDGDDIICGLGGDDQIQALDGKDLVSGGAGADDVSGGRGHDVLNGSGGRDTLKGNEGIDTLRGFGGNDVLAGGDGRDQLTGGEGDDILRGWDGDDTLNGATGDDVLRGGQGVDACNGGPGRDEVFGCEG